MCGFTTMHFEREAITHHFFALCGDFQHCTLFTVVQSSLTNAGIGLEANLSQLTLRRLSP